MKKVIIDTSSAILLFKSGIITDFFSAYHVVVTQSVQDEILQDGYTGSSEFLHYFKNKGINLTIRNFSIHAVNLPLLYL